MQTPTKKGYISLHQHIHFGTKKAFVSFVILSMNPCHGKNQFYEFIPSNQFNAGTVHLPVHKNFKSLVKHVIHWSWLLTSIFCAVPVLNVSDSARSGFTSYEPVWTEIIVPAILNRWEDAVQRPRKAYVYVSVRQMKGGKNGQGERKTKRCCHATEWVGVTEFQRLLHSHKDKLSGEECCFGERGKPSSFVGPIPLASSWQEAPGSLQARKSGKLFVWVKRTIS